VIRSRTLFVVALSIWGIVSTAFYLAVSADPDRIPGEAKVALSRRERIFFDPNPISTYMYPEGKLDFKAVEAMLDEAVGSLTGVADPVAAWRAMVKPVDTVGIMVDVRDLPVHLVVIDAVVQKLIRAGVQESNVVIFAGEENDLFNAGFAINRDGPGIRCLGSERQGYRGETSRIVLDDCTALVDVSRLRVDRQIGVSGSIANHLSCIPMVDRVQLLNNPTDMAAVANRPTIRRKILLHILDALQPAYDFQVGRKLPPRWDYRGLFVSHDPVALDALGAVLLTKYREQVKGGPWPLAPSPDYITTATVVHALGQSDLSQIKLIKTGYDEGGLL
jgi:hypothetical protein